MKTAISVPDETFDRASRRASDLGMSRSEFFTQAAQRYLDQLDAHSLSRDIDSALERLDGPDDSATLAVTSAHHRMTDSNDDW
ncbi:MAG: ribbon-helix-helix protein, CopG family [Chloroflexota bacterium]|nr:MAG: antitoxin [Chloroflexota bacterium]